MNRKTASVVLVAATFLCACASTYGADSARLQSYRLALRLHEGERLVEHTYENDQIEWKLPKKRLEHFRNSGVVITEEQHLTGEVRSTVVWISGGVARFLAVANLTSVDVPRRKVQSLRQTFATSLAANNLPLSSQPLRVEDAAMAELPSAAIRAGQHWQTRFAVTTSLGSGYVTFDHEAVSAENGLLKILVRGRGAITGREYHLPKLLPGSIELSGAAWYDLHSGLIAQESYLLHNRLLKPMESEQQGFDERLTVDISVHRV